MNKTQTRMLEKAIELSKLSTCRQKHGVVIARGSRVVAVAVNTFRNHPNVVSDPHTQASYHAEVNAIKQIIFRDITGLTLYSARTNSRGEPMLAKPCLECQELIDKLNIKKVFHT